MTSLCGILLLRTKIGANWTMNRWDIAKLFFEMAAVRHFEFAKFWLRRMTVLGITICICIPFHFNYQSAPQIQLWCWHCAPYKCSYYYHRLQYSDKTIIGGRPPSWIFEICCFGHVTCVCLILLIRTKFDVNRRKIKPKTTFKMAAVRIFKFAQFWLFVTWPLSELKFSFARQISSKSDVRRAKYSDKTIFKMAIVRRIRFVVTSS